jgi:hypothetical protein
MPDRPAAFLASDAASAVENLIQQAADYSNPRDFLFACARRLEEEYESLCSVCGQPLDQFESCRSCAAEEAAEKAHQIAENQRRYGLRPGYFEAPVD